MMKHFLMLPLVIMVALLAVAGCDSGSASEGFSGIVRTDVTGHVLELDDGEDWRVDCEEFPLAVQPAYPNPTEAVASLDFMVGIAAHLRITIASRPGTRVATVADDSVLAGGAYSISWRAYRTELASGIYRAYVSVTSSDGTTCKNIWRYQIRAPVGVFVDGL